MRSVQIPVKACPWCREIPSFSFGLDKETWLPRVKCMNEKCNVQPEGKYVPIRKSQKLTYAITKCKIQEAIAHWNEGLDMPYEKAFVVDYQKIMEYGRAIRTS